MGKSNKQIGKIVGRSECTIKNHFSRILRNLHASYPLARLSDALNGMTDKGPPTRRKFLELTDVTIQHANGGEEKLKFCYINKSTVQLVVTFGGVDAGRGIGRKNGPRPYPFVEKSPIPVHIETNDYIINGNMHRMNYQEVWQVMEETSTFLPLTYVHVCTLATDDLEMFPFAVINKDHIISLQESNVKQEVGEELTIAGILINRL